MAAMTWANVQARFPADLTLAAISSNDGATYMAGAVVHVGQRSFWGAYFDEALAHYAAHLATQAAPGGSQPVGPVVSSSVAGGSLSRAYAAPVGVPPGLAATRYGVAYHQLWGQAAAGTVLVV